ncbi:ADP-ribosylation factor-like protein 13B isoform X2 [Malaya genurostris]|uniref:ADP-ribosylation factor-like protein 13B isoform X2 n=1 Tax=Malaya genurostris TaxID=325434 RepID=UPI0026F3EC31|nr:ADP-ribosylation factor-like protein 13B isoform X2 [Malaya genurostris]
MGNCFTRCFMRVQPEETVLRLLIVGLENAGKTEIAHKICGSIRTEFLQTKGCRAFHTNIEGTRVQLSEVGGAQEFLDIWKYYFLDVYGILFVVDSSNINCINQSYNIFERLMAHDLLVGKPFLIIANKQDLPCSIDCIDLCECMNVEVLANKYRNPCMIEVCGNWNNSDDAYDGLQSGIRWLVKTILMNKQLIMNSIKFHRGICEFESILKASRRPWTGLSHNS